MQEKKMFWDLRDPAEPVVLCETQLLTQAWNQQEWNINNDRDAQAMLDNTWQGNDMTKKRSQELAGSFEHKHSVIMISKNWC